MQGLAEAGQNRLLTPLANEAGVDQVPMTGLSNELALDSADGWAVIPYGEWPHEEGLQRFGRAEADEMVGYYKNLWNSIKRALVGMPIYRGHPDLPALANQYPDKKVYGHIIDMEARPAGLALRLVVSEDGASLVNEKGLNKFSPHWLAKPLPAEAGRKVWAPVFMKSIGLTDRPNIPSVTSLINSRSASADDSTRQPDTTMPKWLIELLGLANEATQDDITAKVKLLLARPEQTALANEQSRVTALTNELAGAKTKVTEAETALANERLAHATSLVDSAVLAGRITEAQKPTWLERLKANFATESVALANEKAVKTTARTGALGDRKPASAAGDQFVALVNEAMPKNGNNWTASWNAVKATEQGKALFEQMNLSAAQ